MNTPLAPSSGQAEGGLTGGEQSPLAPSAPNPQQGSKTMPGGEEVDPRQVAQFLEMSWRIIYGGDTSDGELNSGIAGMLRSGPQGGQASDPIQSLADTAATVASKVITASEGSGSMVDGAAAFVGMMELVGELATDAEDEGIYNYTQEDIDAAAVRASESLYNQTKDTGAFPQGEMQMDAQKMAQQSQSGELDAGIQAMLGGV